MVYRFFREGLGSSKRLGGRSEKWRIPTAARAASVYTQAAREAEERLRL
jgi:hypothetical protein